MWIKVNVEYQSTETIKISKKELANAVDVLFEAIFDKKQMKK